MDTRLGVIIALVRLLVIAVLAADEVSKPWPNECLPERREVGHSSAEYALTSNRSRSAAAWAPIACYLVGLYTGSRLWNIDRLLLVWL
jgi:hypothetical protein